MSDRSEQRERDRARLTRHPRLGNLEMLSARYRDHAYALHTHSTYVLGVVVAGVEKLRIGRRQHMAPAGSIIVVNPEEPHDGEKGCGAGWAYRTCYPSAGLMREIADDLGMRQLPMFANGILQAPKLARAFVRAHRSAAAGTATDSEAAMLEVLHGIVSRFADPDGRTSRREDGEAAARFGLYRGLIEADLAASFDLTRLAQEAGVTRFQVIRDFRRVAAMTPGQYVRDRRVRRATSLMRTDMKLAEIAAETGFADQSHLTRLFKAMKGLPPGAYRSGTGHVTAAETGAAPLPRNR